MTSSVEICNSALDEIGHDDAITSLTSDTSKAARLCNRQYDIQRRYLLRLHPWNFGRKRTELAQLSSNPDFGYNYQYALPSDFIRFVSINENPEDRIDYSIEKPNVLTDESSMKVVYIYDQTDPAKFDFVFTELLALSIARKIAYSLTGSQSVAKEMRSLFAERFIEATGVNASENFEKQVERSAWIDARDSRVT